MTMSTQRAARSTKYTRTNPQEMFLFSCLVRLVSVRLFSVVSYKLNVLGQEDIESLQASIQAFAQRLPREVQSVKVNFLYT